MNFPSTWTRILSLALTSLACPSLLVAADFHTELVQATFKIEGEKSEATSFVLGRSRDNQVQRILVTAKHVLSQMEGNEATLWLREKAPDGSYHKLAHKVAIRHEGKELWTSHPSSDVAVMLLNLPEHLELPNISTESLASDNDLNQPGIHPGALVRCTGYPHAAHFEPNHAGFPLVRLGCIASYPLLPTSTTKTFLIDCNTFEGDSGAAVSLPQPSPPSADGKEHENRDLILGLVSGQHFIDERYKLIYQSGFIRKRMGLAIIVHAAAIRETIEMLP